MRRKFFPDRIIYSFAIQLVVMHIKKNQLMLLYWLLLFGFVSQSFSKRFGIPYLFLDPEYLGKVNIISFFIVGVACGVFIMAFNISSYILNSFRFPFLASLSKSFQKYTFNNFIIPLLFIILYVAEVVYFQYFSQFKTPWEIAVNISGFLSGIFLVVLFTLRYFLLTNKDIYKLFGVEQADAANKLTDSTAGVAKKPLNKRRKFTNSKTWHVETYFVLPFNTRLVRNTEHYKHYMLQSVFKQNHINAAVMELIVFSVFILLGLFREFKLFQIPAAASVILLFTMFIMLSGVFRFWLKSWANTGLVILFIVLNYFSQFEFFNQRNKAIGLDYSQPRKEYSIDVLDTPDPNLIERDKAQTLLILEKWKHKWNVRGVEKPKLVVVNISGGGLRSSLFTFRTMQVVDSVLNGQLMDHTRLIAGSSGGVIGASYYRGLFLENKALLMDTTVTSRRRLLDNISSDLLNTTAFSFTVSDIFMSMQSFREGKNTYYKDRGYAFEKQLNENLGYVLDKKLGDYVQPEQQAEIPMLIVSPTIINDGRVMMISPVGISYMLQQTTDTLSTFQFAPDGIEYTRFFAGNNPLNTRYTSILRMNATFPYIMPAASMPTIPPIEVMDAGIRDNYGVLNSVRFIYEFREWIKNNTSGIVFVQIRDTNKKMRLSNTSLSTIVQKITAPVRNVSGNFLLMQDYIQDDYLKYMSAWLECPIDFVPFQLPQLDEKIALSWHLTEKEKKFLRDAIYTSDNKKSLERMGSLLNYNLPVKEIAAEKINRQPTP
jgi:hypothetical protein